LAQGVKASAVEPQSTNSSENAMEVLRQPVSSTMPAPVEVHDVHSGTRKDSEGFGHHYNVKVLNMAGTQVELPPLLATLLVQDLALWVRKHFGIPLCAMKLLKDGEIISELTLPLINVFGADVVDVDMVAVRRQLSEDEQAELDKGLVRRAAEGRTAEVEECLVEGAQVDPKENPCGGLSALMVAIAAGHEGLCVQLRQAGAPEPDMTPKTSSIGKAFASESFVEVTRRIAAGDNVDARLSRGQGLAATSSGTPLHACCAMHRLPGSTELAQLLMHKRANLDAGDSEGDTPLAHARYFGAQELYQVLQSRGAEMGGPFYRYRNFGRDD